MNQDVLFRNSKNVKCRRQFEIAVLNSRFNESRCMWVFLVGLFFTEVNVFGRGK